MSVTSFLNHPGHHEHTGINGLPGVLIIQCVNYVLIDTNKIASEYEWDLEFFDARSHWFLSRFIFDIATELVHSWDKSLRRMK